MKALAPKQQRVVDELTRGARLVRAPRCAPILVLRNGMTERISMTTLDALLAAEAVVRGQRDADHRFTYVLADP